MDAQVENGLFAGFFDLFFHLFGDLGDYLLDPGGMDPAVADEFCDGDPRDFPADRVETGQDDRFRRVVDDDVDACCCLQRRDVAPFPAYDPALHLFVGKRDDGDRVLADVLAGITLDGKCDYLLRLLVRLFPRFFLDLLDHLHRFEAGFLLHALNEHLFCLFGRHARYLFKLFPGTCQKIFLFPDLGLKLVVLVGDLAVLTGKIFFLLFKGVELLIYVQFLLAKPALRVLHFDLAGFTSCSISLRA